MLLLMVLVLVSKRIISVSNSTPKRKVNEVLKMAVVED